MLFTTKTCPNCSVAKQYLDQANIPYEIVESESNLELVSKFKIMSVPALIVQNGDTAKQYANATNIRSFAESYVR